MHEKRELSKISFNTKEELVDFLQKLVADIDSEMEFNLICHQISDISDYFSQYSKNLPQLRMMGILNKGLDTSNYGSVFSTSTLITTSTDANIENVVNYQYYKMTERVVAIFALPKYINVDGEKVEFSSYKGRALRMRDTEIMETYRKNNVFPLSDHVKCCMLDAVTNYGNLPVTTLLGCYVINEKENIFEFISAKTHFVYDKYEQAKYLEEQEKKIKQIYSKYCTNEVETLCVKSYQSEEKYWNDLADEV